MVEAETATVPAVEIRGLTKRFGPTAVLNGVDLEVKPREIVVVNGPSGAGKSTLLHLIAALDTPDAGTISVNGHLVTGHHRQARYRRSEVGIIFQLHNLVPRLSAVENVELAMFGTGLRRHRRRQRAIELLGAVDLTHRLDAAPPTLSGGERQRVAIARALANRPQLLLADEPTGSLDDEAAAGVVRLLSRLRDEQGVAILAVNHDPRLDPMADRVARLADGRISERARV